MRHVVFMETVWPAILPAVDYIQSMRTSELPIKARAGINFSIVLGSACYLEGVLETGMKAFLRLHRENYNSGEFKNFNARRSTNHWYNRLESNTEIQICRATGETGYNEMFKLLIDQSLSELDYVKPVWEGISVLFRLRNVLGHGREVTAHQVFSSSLPEEHFRGGYQQAENYLRKLKLIDRKFTSAHAEYLFLSDSVADHFWALAKQVPNAILDSLVGEEKDFFERAVIKGETVGAAAVPRPRSAHMKRG